MRSICMRYVIITITLMLSVSVIGCHGLRDSQVFTCGYVKQKTEEERRVYEKIRELQKELRTIQLRFNEVHRELAQLRMRVLQDRIVKLSEVTTRIELTIPLLDATNSNTNATHGPHTSIPIAKVPHRHANSTPYNMQLLPKSTRHY